MKALAVRWFLALLESNDLIECRVNALDLRAEQRLFAHVHADEQIRIGKERCNAIELSKGVVGPREQIDGLAVEYKGRMRRQRRWDIGEVAAGLGHGPSCPRLHCFHISLLQLVLK